MKKTNQFTQKERTEIIKTLYEHIGYVPKCILSQLFTRSSFTSQYGGRNNEEFEFIGDSVIGYYAIKILTDKFFTIDNNNYYHFKLNYQKIEHLKKEIVSNKNLARIIDEWGLAKYLIVGKTDIQNHIDENEKVKADLFEAIIGGIAVHCHFNPEIIENSVFNALSMQKEIDKVIDYEYIINPVDINNAVTKLKELAEHGEINMPEYIIKGPETFGYDKNGQPIWNCDCVISNFARPLNVFANSKKDAKKAVAYLTLIKHLDLPNKYGPSKRDILWYYKNNKFVKRENFLKDYR